MTSQDLYRPDLRDRRARAAAAAFFLTNGGLFASMVPHYPQIKMDLALNNTIYGLAVAAFPAGAILAGMAAAVLIRKFTSAKVALFGTVLTASMVFLVGLVPSVPTLIAALLVAGASDAITDVAQNAQGLRVQRRYGRSIINSLHAVWSAGVVLGGLGAAGAIAVGMPRSTHLILVAILLAAVAVLAWRYSLHGPDDTSVTGVDTATVTNADSVVESEAVLRSRTRVLVALGGMAIIGIVACAVEDAGSSWATLYLSTSLGAPAGLAVLGYVALAAAQFVGRATGDRLVDRFGVRRVTRAGGLLITVGLGCALMFPSVPGTILGFAAAGFGVATLGPNVMAACDELPGLRPGTGLTVVSWLMRAGFLFAPPLVGAIADAATLRTGLIVFPVAGALVVLMAGVMPKYKREEGPLASS
ncbi:MFS transporter [Populibacterium corticicola]|uniref:MFS transporter n=1 Tax=Populibacterium corticicola TaxID=1812826 RepID=A0ABW5XDA3_9MICO